MEKNNLIGHMGQPLDDEPTEGIFLTQAQIYHLVVAIGDSIEKAADIMGILENEENPKKFFDDEEDLELLREISLGMLMELPPILEELEEATKLLEAHKNPLPKIHKP